MHPYYVFILLIYCSIHYKSLYINIFYIGCFKTPPRRIVLSKFCLCSIQCCLSCIKSCLRIMKCYLCCMKFCLSCMKCCLSCMKCCLSCIKCCLSCMKYCVSYMKCCLSCMKCLTLCLCYRTSERKKVKQLINIQMSCISSPGVLWVSTRSVFNYNIITYNRKQHDLSSQVLVIYIIMILVLLLIIESSYSSLVKYS